MILSTHPYFSALEQPKDFPLDRYLPPYQPGVLTQMLHSKGIHDGWILDPIGSHPLAAIELANAGFQVMVACSNPILAKLYEVISANPSRLEIQAAISEFGALKIGDERLEVGIKNLYESDCPNCSELSNHTKFMWKKGEITPFAKELNCDSCGFNGEAPISKFDLSKLAMIGNSQLFESRAIQRVLPGSEEPPSAVKEIIQSYLPRSLAIITRLINKNDSFQTTPERKRIIEALILLACDYGTMLWGIPAGRSRPKVISISNLFWEFNLWEIIENGANLFSSLTKGVPLSIFPQLPPSDGGICLFPNRIRRSEEFSGFPQFKLIATILPRPNQALWTYSAVWAGWVWGHSAVTKLRGVLDRKRHDWIWHTFALKKLFEFSAPKNTPWFATAPELTPNYLLSFLSAPASSGYQLQDYAYNPQYKSAQLYWQVKDKGIREASDLTIINYLESKGEEASYNELLNIHLLQQAYQELLLPEDKKIESDLYLELSKEFEKQIKNPTNIRKLDQDSLEYGEFWLAHPPNRYRPLADQIEIQFLQYLQSDPIVSVLEMESIINQKQPGCLPSFREIIVRLLESYCDPIPAMDDTWQLRTQETSMIRRADIRILKNMVISMGQRIGVNVITSPEIIWETPAGLANYRFFVSGSCIFSRFLDQKTLNSGDEIVIIYPGSRAELLNYKTKRSIVLAQQFAKIHFVKYRHIRNMNENPDLTVKTWVRLIDSDPAIWQEFGQPVLF